MTQSVTNAIGVLATKLRALSGIKNAPNVPPEDAGLFPFGVAYEATGTTNANAEGFANDIVTIFVEVHVARVLLGNAVLQAMAFRDPFLVALLSDPTLGGTVSTINEIRRTFGRLEWGGVETIGYRFEVDVKVVMAY
jgi:hypothetical protein